LLAVERVVRVSAGIEGVEGIAAVILEWQSELDALRQIRIRNEVTPERDQISITLLDDGFGGIRLEAPSCSCSDATGACPSATSTLPFTRGSMM
jgi:hypothetical protein